MALDFEHSSLRDLSVCLSVCLSVSGAAGCVCSSVCFGRSKECLFVCLFQAQQGTVYVGRCVAELLYVECITTVWLSCCD